MITQCEVAPVGTDPKQILLFAVGPLSTAIPQDTVWEAVKNVGKFAGNEKYFLRTWDKAANHTREKIYQKAQAKAEQPTNPKKRR